MFNFFTGGLTLENAQKTCRDEKRKFVEFESCTEFHCTNGSFKNSAYIRIAQNPGPNFNAIIRSLMKYHPPWSKASREVENLTEGKTPYYLYILNQKCIFLKPQEIEKSYFFQTCGHS